MSRSAEIPLPRYDVPDTDFVPRSDSSSDSLEHHEGNSSSASDNAGHPDPEEVEDITQPSILEKFEADVFDSIRETEFTFMRGIENFHAFLKKKLGKDHNNQVFVEDGTLRR